MSQARRLSFFGAFLGLVRPFSRKLDTPHIEQGNRSPVQSCSQSFQASRQYFAIAGGARRLPNGWRPPPDQFLSPVGKSELQRLSRSQTQRLRFWHIDFLRIIQMTVGGSVLRTRHEHRIDFAGKQLTAHLAGTCRSFCPHWVRFRRGIRGRALKWANLYMSLP